MSTTGFILALCSFPGFLGRLGLVGSSVSKTDIFNHCGLEPSRNCVASFTEMGYADLAGSAGLYGCVGMVSEPK